jgi:hypothetical protein
MVVTRRSTAQAAAKTADESTHNAVEAIPTVANNESNMAHQCGRSNICTSSEPITVTKKYVDPDWTEEDEDKRVIFTPPITFGMPSTAMVYPPVHPGQSGIHITGVNAGVHFPTNNNCSYNNNDIQCTLIWQTCHTITAVAELADEVDDLNNNIQDGGSSNAKVCAIKEEEGQSVAGDTQLCTINYQTAVDSGHQEQVLTSSTQQGTSGMTYTDLRKLVHSTASTGICMIYRFVMEVTTNSQPILYCDVCFICCKIAFIYVHKKPAVISVIFANATKNCWT